MPKYIVHLVRTTVQSASVEVVAVDVTDADAAAYELLNTDIEDTADWLIDKDEYEVDWVEQAVDEDEIEEE